MYAIRNVLCKSAFSMTFDARNIDFPDFNCLLLLRDQSKYNKHVSTDNCLGIFLPSWTPHLGYFSGMHTIPPIFVLNTIKSTQQKRKQNTAKDQMRHTEDERILPWCRFIMTSHERHSISHCSLTDDLQGWKSRQYIRQTYMENS